MSKEAWVALFYYIYFNMTYYTFQAEEDDEAGEADLNVAVTLLNKTKE